MVDDVLESGRRHVDQQLQCRTVCGSVTDRLTVAWGEDMEKWSVWTPNMIKVGIFGTKQGEVLNRYMPGRTRPTGYIGTTCQLNQPFDM